MRWHGVNSKSTKWCALSFPVPGAPFVSSTCVVSTDSTTTFPTSTACPFLVSQGCCAAVASCLMTWPGAWKDQKGHKGAKGRPRAKSGPVAEAEEIHERACCSSRRVLAYAEDFLAGIPYPFPVQVFHPVATLATAQTHSNRRPRIAWPSETLFASVIDKTQPQLRIGRAARRYPELVCECARSQAEVKKPR